MSKLTNGIATQFEAWSKIYSDGLQVQKRLTNPNKLVTYKYLTDKNAEMPYFAPFKIANTYPDNKAVKYEDISVNTLGTITLQAPPNIIGYDGFVHIKTSQGKISSFKLSFKGTEENPNDTAITQEGMLEISKALYNHKDDTSHNVFLVVNNKNTSYFYILNNYSYEDIVNGVNANIRYSTEQLRVCKEKLQIYYEDDNGDKHKFPYDYDGIEIDDYTYTSVRMGACNISASFYYYGMLDKKWTDSVFTEFRGERFYLKAKPSSTKDNDDIRYKYDAEFYPERITLDNIYLYDLLQDESKEIKLSTNINIYGDLSDLCEIINRSLTHSESKYKVVIDKDVTSSEMQVNLEDLFISEALVEAFNIFGIPFYYQGYEIHFGYSSSKINRTIKYGKDEALLSISKTNQNNKIVTKVSGRGSSENIPYYYPNETDDREYIEALGKKWITPTGCLMPSVFRETEGKEAFYYAISNKYPRPDVGYYEFENEYDSKWPKEQIVDFSDVKPTIVGITNNSGQRIDVLADVAFDDDDNDNVSSDSNVLEHPYFYIKLHKMDGEMGFNLFEQAITANNPMTISMTSGDCGACNFEIQVLELTSSDGKQIFKNPVQVDSEGNLVAGNASEKINTDNIIESQQDTKTNSVWIAVKKENSTYGTVMPSQLVKPKAGDSFVILYIDLPEAYISDAEERLDEKIIAYMAANNESKFNYSIKFSRIFFAENPDIFEELNENTIITLSYQEYDVSPFYISSYTITASSDSEIPEITVELTKSLTSSSSTITDTIIKEVTGDIVANYGLPHVIKLNDNIAESDDNVYSALRTRRDFISKVRPDSTNYQLGLKGGAVFGKNGYAEGMTGFGGKIDSNANAELESLSLRRFLTVPEIHFNKAEVYLGDKWRAPGGGIIETVDVKTRTCTLKLEEGEIGAVSVGDICMGIYHSYNNDDNFTKDSDDSKGNRTFAGFCTVYFTVTWVGGDNNNKFKYEIRNTSSSWYYSFHPFEMMNFVVYGNFSNEERQTSVYETRTYTRMLWHQNTWEISKENIAMQYGDLSNLNVFGLNMSGYSQYVNSVYFTGTISQIAPDGTPIKTANERGEWVEGTLYNYYDRVSYNGSLYLCINESGTYTKPTDSSNWILQVDKGDKGDKGDQGPEGPQGIQGFNGCIVRSSEWKSGTKYRNDNDLQTNDEKYLDVALVRDNSMATGWRAYKCLKTHSSSSANAPAYGLGTYWEEFGTNTTSIFTSLIVAKDALIQFFNGNRLLIMDDNGNVTAGIDGYGTTGSNARFWAGATYSNRQNAPFLVTRDGSLKASKGVFSGFIQVPFEPLVGNTVNFGRGQYTINDKLNIMCSLDATYGSDNYTKIYLPSSLDSVGKVINIYEPNARTRVMAPPYFKVVESTNYRILDTKSSDDIGNGQLISSAELLGMGAFIQLLAVPAPAALGTTVNILWIILTSNLISTTPR